MIICDYGCGQEANYQFKNGKWCCSENCRSCPATRKKISESNKGQNAWNKGKTIGPCSEKIKTKISKSLKGISFSKDHKKKISKGKKLIIKQIKEKYPTFSKIEEMRYNPDKPEEKEIQVHCKNHNCKNSKEKEGWFTPTGHQFDGRRRALEDKNGNDGTYLYCSQYCKDTCPLYRLRSDPYKDNSLPYTYTEYQTFRTFVLERDKYICQFCGKQATHVHHERPQKLEPFFSLDPDYAWSCCEKCHYEKGHKDECSTGNLAKIVCSVESQKFLSESIKVI